MLGYFPRTSSVPRSEQFFEIELKYATEAVHCTKSNKVKQGLLSKICTIENMGELYSVILLLVLLLVVLLVFYVYRIFILFFGHFNDNFFLISLAKMALVSYVRHLYEDNYVNVRVDAAVDVLS